jgi:hypothetical protein
MMPPERPPFIADTNGAELVDYDLVEKARFARCCAVLALLAAAGGLIGRGFGWW